MRTLVFIASLLVGVGVEAVVGGAVAHAQVTDAERAAARDLFHQGDELQRAGKFGEALDKFQRAQQAYSAPTNVLRIAECQAALGKLVESAESYRSIALMTLPSGSSPAFQAAVDQAKGELAQVEPRVPRLVVQVSAGAATNAQLQIDGQNVSAALIGEPIPLDPGIHRVRIIGTGGASSEQDALLKERETTTIVAALKPSAGAPPLPAPPPALPAPPPRSTAAPAGPAMTSTEVAVPPPYAVPPPPPAIPDRQGAFDGPPPSRTGLLFGGHLGWEIAGGKVPLGGPSSVDTSTVANGGLAYALDGGFRFARHWYAGLSLEHAAFSHGDLTQLGASDASSSTTLLAATIGFIGNPDRVSFFGELGIGARWFFLSQTVAGTTATTDYSSGEFALGIGLWIPLGPSFRLLPKATLGLGTFGDPAGSSSNETHSFAMLGVTGLYNIDF